MVYIKIFFILTPTQSPSDIPLIIDVVGTIGIDRYTIRILLKQGATIVTDYRRTTTVCWQAKGSIRISEGTCGRIICNQEFLGEGGFLLVEIKTSEVIKFFTSR